MSTPRTQGTQAVHRTKCICAQNIAPDLYPNEQSVGSGLVLHAGPRTRQDVMNPLKLAKNSLLNCIGISLCENDTGSEKSS